MPFTESDREKLFECLKNGLYTSAVWDGELCDPCLDFKWYWEDEEDEEDFVGCGEGDITIGIDFNEEKHGWEIYSIDICTGSSVGSVYTDHTNEVVRGSRRTLFKIAETVVEFLVKKHTPKKMYVVKSDSDEFFPMLPVTFRAASA